MQPLSQERPLQSSVQLTKKASVDNAAGVDTAFLDSMTSPEIDETAWYAHTGGRIKWSSSRWTPELR